METKFSLKDHLFNENKVNLMAKNIREVCPEFKNKKFVQKVINKFPELELKERITWIRQNLEEFLPSDYQTAINILLHSLPPELDPNKSDDDFGDFIWAPYGDFVAANGCTTEHLNFSLNTLEQMTKRFSCEGPIREFLNTFPEKTLAQMQTWSQSKNYHVRRLASEGCRPKLPWAPKIHTDSEDGIRILDNLYFDRTRYVTRSVANHLNDVSKTNPNRVLSTLKKWQNSEKQTETEMNFIINHSLRTLVKKGHADTMTFLGFSPDPKVKLNNFKIKTPTVKVGNTLAFSFDITAQKDEPLIIDYTLYFVKKTSGFGNKVFKLKKISLKAGEKITINKKHPLKKMSTRTLYPGIHEVEIQINGKSLGKKKFLLQ